MRILAVTPFLPDPDGDHGGAVYLGSLLRELACQAELTVVALGGPGEPPASPLGKARVIQVPHAHLRDLQGRERLWHWGRMAWAHGLARVPLLAAKHASSALRAVIRKARETAAPQVALLELAAMAQYLPDLAGIPTVLTDHERGEPLPVGVGPGGLGRSRDARLWQRFVRTYYPQATLLQALTQDDASHLAAMLGRKVLVRGPAVIVPDAPVDPGRAPPRALFVGNYLHAPNPEAAAALVRDVWPLVLEGRPDAELWIAGPHAPAEVLAMASAPGVRVLGAVEDLGKLLGQVRMLLAPLFSGGGVRIKVLTAMAHGLPVVSNALGMRGLQPPPHSVRLGETGAALAALVLDLLDRPELGAASGRAAREWVAQHASPRAVAALQLQRCRALLAR